jgi:hypothetical protein
MTFWQPSSAAFDPGDMMSTSGELDLGTARFVYNLGL